MSRHTIQELADRAEKVVLAAAARDQQGLLDLSKDLYAWGWLADESFPRGVMSSAETGQAVGKELLKRGVLKPAGYRVNQDWLNRHRPK